MHTLKLALITLVIFSTIAAQGQTTQASISGKITDSQNKDLAGATVEIYNTSTGFTTKTVSGNSGAYIFNELPLGGPYYVLVTSVGFATQKKENIYLNQGDAITVNMVLEETAQNLENVTVSASSGMKTKIENIGAATAISARTMTHLPINGRNFANLADLSPLSRGGSISGQLGSSTNYTIDGMNSKNPTSAGPTTSRSGAPYSISIEAVREFKVVTNQYDVTYGRSGGGTISAVTKSGTNTFSGSAFSYIRANELSSRYDIRGNRRVNDYATQQYGFSLGGPIIKNKLHFFVAWDHQNDTRSLVIADVQSPADENRFNITQIKLDSIVNTGREKYGISDHAQYGSFDKKRGSDAAFARIDWQINSKNLLTIRDNYTNDRNRLGLIDNTSINLYESAGNDFNRDNSLLATLRTSVNSRVTNELKLQHLHTFQSSEPGDELPPQNIPRGIIENVSSVLSDGTTKSTNVQFGGHRFAQEGFTNNVVQLVDNLYFNTNKINYTFGIDLMYTHAKSLYGSEVNGRFHYTGLQNFIDNKPYRYYREVPLMDDPTVISTIFNTGIYGQLQTKLARGLDFTGGLRFDYAHYPSSPLNQLVYDELGISTNNRIKSFVIQPRLQFTWNVNESNTDYVRLGAGVFASDINNYMVINNLTFDGKHYGTVDVQGAGVPPADFIGYRQDPSATPTLQAFQVATINTNGKDVKVPVVYKANVSYSKFITNRLRVGITGLVTLGRNNYFYVDRNMADDPFFRLANEDNRGVYVPANTINANNAATNWLMGRKSDKLGRVLELVSAGKVNQKAVIVDATWQYLRDGEISASYTWNDSKDNESYNGNVANTATLSLPVKDDPRNLSLISYSDNQFRNKIVFYGTSPSFKGFNVGLRYSGIGGTRYTLLSGLNSNGDFVSSTNDLAFIFDPNNPNTPQNIKDGLNGLLDNAAASSSIKEYIKKYEGKLAGRNGGVNGFYGVFDLRLAYVIKIYKTQRLEISGDMFNVLNFFNRKWGTNKSLGNQALYAQSGFDTAAQQFKYRVNNSGVVSPSGDPYQIQIGLRYSF